MHRKFFNMIEIMLAMTVISIGFIGVISLLPLGITTNRDAIENTYVTMAAENMANYIKSQVKRYDYAYWCKTNINNGEFVPFSGVNVYALESELFVPMAETLPNPVSKEDGGFTTSIIPGGGAALPNLFTMKRGTNPKSFLMSWVTEINGVPATDFECIVMVGMRGTQRQNPSSCQFWNRFRSEGRVYPSLSVTNIRVEWPADAKIENRSYKEFSYYIY